VSGQVLFPELEGAELQIALQDAYRPASKLGINDAKDTLYLVIERRQDSVRGVYSGFIVDLPNGVDPSQHVFRNGSGINLEHVYPQSKGADEGQPGHSDMHHLFPTRVAVNSARGSFPFHDIPDQQTTTWFKGGGSMQSIPSSDIDGYSESVNGAFEPRESVKGNVARAVFYFYTMYREDADAADPDFFPVQREELCQWHLDDPVDELELQRSAAVAFYQDGKENPYVLDCTAALRAWCPGLTGCVTAQENPEPLYPFSVSAFATQGEIIVTIETEISGRVDLTVFDATGRILSATPLNLIAGTSEYVIDGEFAAGIYTISIANPVTGKLVSTRCLVIK
jgi:hypothetical protein